MFKINTNISQSYLTYRIGKEIFALDSTLVRNILDVTPNIKNSNNKIYIEKKEVLLVDVMQNQILAPVEINNTYMTDFIDGIVKSVKQIIRLVNMNKLLSFANNIKKVHVKNERELVLGF